MTTERLRGPATGTLFACGLGMVMTLVGLWVRPPLAIDETRYLSVAWEMRVTGDYLLPHLNGELYAHKPPLLFWLINLVWLVCGVGEFPARLIAPAVGWICLWQTGSLARRLWPEQDSASLLAPVLLVGMIVWSLFASLTMFDTLVVSSLLLGFSGLLGEWRDRSIGNLVRIAASMALGLLAKGPALLVYIVPVVISAPLWARESPRSGWLGSGLRVLAAGTLGTLVAAAWFVPAVWTAGRPYLEGILTTQVIGRTIDTFAHGRPFWWYLPLLPVVTIPWLLWRTPWKSLLSSLRLGAADMGTRFCLAWIAGALLILSAVGGKQVHYLLPLLPAVSLLLARHADMAEVMLRRTLLVRGLSFQLLGLSILVSPLLPLPAKVVGYIPAWFGLVPWLSSWAVLGPRRQTTLQVVTTTSFQMALNLTAFQFAIEPTYFDNCRLEPFARLIGQMQERGAEIAFTGGVYHGQFQFLGRLRRPIPVLADEIQLEDWLAAHPQGYVIEDRRPGRRETIVPTRAGVEVLETLYTLRGFSWQRFQLWRRSALPRPPAMSLRR